MNVAATLFKKVDYTLSKLILDIEHGEIGLPDIQRPFVWKSARVRDLFDSMYKGFPIGYLLFWSNGVPDDGMRQIGTMGKQQQVPYLLIVDGQQRLTSLYAVLKGKPVLNDDYKETLIQIAFRPKDAKFEVTDAAIRRDPEFIPDISRLWADGATSYSFVKRYLENLRDHKEVTPELEDTISGAIDRLYDIQNYPLTALEVSAVVSEEQVAEIFVRINSQGVQLNQGDFILTLMSVFWDEGRAELERFSRLSRTPPKSVQPSPYNHFIEPDPDQLLRVAAAFGFKRARLQHVYSILRGKDLETGQFSEKRRVEQFAILKSAQSTVLDLGNWHEFFKALVSAGYRNASMISSKNALMYAYALYLVGKEQFRVDPFELRNVIAKWFFMISVTARYSGSPETVMEEDLRRVRDIKTAEQFKEGLNRVIRDTLTSDFWDIALVNALETSSPRSPALLAYYAALNILGAPVLFSRVKVSELFDPSTRSTKEPLERHHLFPKAYLADLGMDDLKLKNQAANFTFVEWGDNLGISDRPPAEYLPHMAARCSPEELNHMRDLHALPENWHEMEYEVFLEERRRLMAQVTRKAFEKLESR